MRAAYEQGRCDVLTTDQSGLYADRTGLKNPDDHVILPEVISKEPLGPAVRQGDDEWGDVVRWTLFAMVQAEESGREPPPMSTTRRRSPPTRRSSACSA